LWKVSAGDARRDALTFFDLVVQEDKAILVACQELVQRNVPDGCDGGACPIGISYYGIKGYCYRCGPTSSIISAGPTAVEVIDVLYARLWQILHVQLHLDPVLDVREGGGSAHARVSARRKVNLNALGLLRHCTLSQKDDANHQCRTYDSTGESVYSVHGLPLS
jgi:hypothetical protein